MIGHALGEISAGEIDERSTEAVVPQSGDSQLLACCNGALNASQAGRDVTALGVHVVLHRLDGTANVDALPECLLRREVPGRPDRDGPRNRLFRVESGGHHHREFGSHHQSLVQVLVAHVHRELLAPTRDPAGLEHRWVRDVRDDRHHAAAGARHRHPNPPGDPATGLVAHLCDLMILERQAGDLDRDRATVGVQEEPKRSALDLDIRGGDPLQVAGVLLGGADRVLDDQVVPGARIDEVPRPLHLEVHVHFRDDALDAVVHVVPDQLSTSVDAVAHVVDIDHGVAISLSSSRIQGIDEPCPPLGVEGDPPWVMVRIATADRAEEHGHEALVPSIAFGLAPTTAEAHQARRIDVGDLGRGRSFRSPGDDVSGTRVLGAGDLIRDSSSDGDQRSARGQCLAPEAGSTDTGEDVVLFRDAQLGQRLSPGVCCGRHLGEVLGHGIAVFGEGTGRCRNRALSKCFLPVTLTDLEGETDLEQLEPALRRAGLLVQAGEALDVEREQRHRLAPFRDPEGKCRRALLERDRAPGVGGRILRSRRGRPGHDDPRPGFLSRRHRTRRPAQGVDPAQGLQREDVNPLQLVCLVER